MATPTKDRENFGQKVSRFKHKTSIVFGEISCHILLQRNILSYLTTKKYLVISYSIKEISCHILLKRNIFSYLILKKYLVYPREISYNILLKKYLVISYIKEISYHTLFRLSLKLVSFLLISVSFLI